MRRLFPALLTALFLLPLASRAVSSPEAPVTKSQVVRFAMERSVRVQVYASGELRRTASGVAISNAPGKDGKPRTQILTNAHVADQTDLTNVVYKVLVEKHGRVERTLTARLLAIGEVPDRDLAVLEVDDVLPTATLAEEPSVDVGDEVVVVGAPYGRSLSVSGGLLSNIEADGGTGSDPLRFTSMKTDAAIGYGSSGGGVFAVPGGRLVGIIEGYRTARVNINEHASFDVPMPGETFIAPVTKVRKFLVDNLGQKLFPAPALEATASTSKGLMPAAVLGATKVP